MQALRGMRAVRMVRPTFCVSRSMDAFSHPHAAVNLQQHRSEHGSCCELLQRRRDLIEKVQHRDAIRILCEGINNADRFAVRVLAEKLVDTNYLQLVMKEHDQPSYCFSALRPPSVVHNLLQAAGDGNSAAVAAVAANLLDEAFLVHAIAEESNVAFISPTEHAYLGSIYQYQGYHYSELDELLDKQLAEEHLADWLQGDSLIIDHFKVWTQLKDALDGHVISALHGSSDYKTWTQCWSTVVLPHLRCRLNE